MVYAAFGPKNSADGHTKPAQSNCAEIWQISLAFEVFRDKLEQNFHAKKSAVADAFFVAFSRVVERAKAGEFSERIGARFDESDYDNLSQATNCMMKSIEKSIWQTSKVVGDLAAGHLGTRMEGSFKGAFASLQRDVNTTEGRLRDVVEKISAASKSITGEVGDLSVSADRLAERSKSQAHALNEENETSKKVNSNIASNAQGAETMAHDAKVAAHKASSGRGTVTDAIEAMNGIEKSSQEVSKIVDVIDDISFRTNLLALNAGLTNRARNIHPIMQMNINLAQQPQCVLIRITFPCHVFKLLLSTNSGTVLGG